MSTDQSNKDLMMLVEDKISPHNHGYFLTTQKATKKKKLHKVDIPLQTILKDKENFEWDNVDLNFGAEQKAFVDKIVEKTELDNMNLELPAGYKTTLEKETYKQMMLIKIKCIIQAVKSDYKKKYKETL